MIKINPEMKEIIAEGLKRNKQLYGKAYCPCKLQKTEDNICMCREFREEDHCHCGLFIKEG